MKKIKKLVWWAVVVVVAIIALSNIWVIASTSQYISDSDIPNSSHNVALVLGTSNKLVDGSDNPFFLGRIEAAARLYADGIVKYIIVSGDNRSKYYNEPVKMRDALVEKGVPASVITLDFAGLRTLDSIIRCKKVFGQDKIIIISQRFHCYRALFISNYLGMDAVGYTANKVPLSQSLRVELREILARPIAIWDTYITDRSPKHLGDKEELNKGEE